MERKIRVAAVSYLNTKPLTYGFERGLMKDKVDLFFEYPAKVAALLMENQADIGLLPVAIIPKLKEYYIISDYCIGADGEVASVCVFSDVPINEIQTIYLDYQSRTSVALLKILLDKHWKLSPHLLAGEVGYENNIGGKVAGLVIGDRAFIQRKKSKYIYDLASAWKEFTGMPFVFAAWVANKHLPQELLNEFNMATSAGLEHLNEIVVDAHYDEYNLDDYYNLNIDYALDEKKKASLELFLQLLKQFMPVS